MKKLNQLLMVAGVATFLGLTSSNLQAQGRGNFDPAEMRQRMMDNIRERLEVKGDDEWKLISERVQKVMDAQRDLRTLSSQAGFFGRGGGRRGGQDAANGGNAGDNANRRNRGGGGGMFGGEPAPELTALEKAIESKASADELKAKIAKLRDAHKEKEGKLTAAQEDLRKVLTARQEAVAIAAGLLK